MSITIKTNTTAFNNAIADLEEVFKLLNNNNNNDSFNKELWEAQEKILKREELANPTREEFLNLLKACGSSSIFETPMFNMFGVNKGDEYTMKLIL